MLLCHVYGLISHQALPDEPHELTFPAMKMLQGVNVAFTQKKGFLSRLGYKPYNYEALPGVSSKEELSISPIMQLRDIEEGLENLMSAFDISKQSDEIQRIYDEAKDSVLYHYRAFSSGIPVETLQRLLAVMKVRCQPGYRSLLENDDPVAMTLWARILILLKGVDGAWWVSGGGRYEVVERDVRSTCDIMPVNVRWMMDWPCRVLHGEIVLKREL